MDGDVSGFSSGPAEKGRKILAPDEVRAVADALSEISVEDLRSRFSIASFNAAQVYPHGRRARWTDEDAASVFEVYRRVPQPRSSGKEVTIFGAMVPNCVSNCVAHWLTRGPHSRLDQEWLYGNESKSSKTVGGHERMVFGDPDDCWLPVGGLFWTSGDSRAAL